MSLEPKKIFPSGAKFKAAVGRNRPRTDEKEEASK
jgi:hypothetical protein